MISIEYYLRSYDLTIQSLSQYVLTFFLILIQIKSVNLTKFKRPLSNIHQTNEKIYIFSPFFITHHVITSFISLSPNHLITYYYNLISLHVIPYEFSFNTLLYYVYLSTCDHFFFSLYIPPIPPPFFSFIFTSLYSTPPFSLSSFLFFPFMLLEHLVVSLHNFFPNLFLI